ncbi:MAG TPA: protein kinase [Pseudonocardiaceae bacterium]|nr:protein kinase [Pseudonocardiaceae bacterium]
MENPLRGGYRLGAALGRGSTGSVVAAAGEQGGEFAIKVLRPELAADHELVTRLMRECVMLARIREPNLVGVHDCVVDGDFVGIVLDLVPGRSLRAHLAEAGTLLPAEVARIGAGVAAALAALHRVGVLHLDLRPENVLLDDAVTPKAPRVAGFGLFGLFVSSAGGSAVPITRPAQYSAPELITEQPAGPATDLYALGILLYELVCGVVPFGGGTDYAVMRHQVHSAPRRPPGVPDLLWAVIEGLLAKDPAARIGPAESVADLLGGMVGELVNAPCATRLTVPPESTPIEPQRPSPPPDPGMYIGPMPVGGAVPKPRRRRAVLITVAVLLVAIGVFAGWALSGAGSGNAQSNPSNSPAPTVQPIAGSIDTQTTTTVPPMTTAPNLVGQQLAKAQDSLPNSIKVTTVDTIDASQQDNTVVSQDPAAGQPLNGTMQLTVARQPVTVYLDTLPTLGNNNGSWQDGDSGTVAGKTYTNALLGRLDTGGCGGSPQYVEYDLGKGYRQLVTSVGIGDSGSDSSVPVNLEIFTDGRQVSTTSISYGQMYPIKVDLSGVLRLRIEWQEVLPATNCSDNTDELVLGSAALLGLPGEVPSDTPTPTN